MKPTTTYVHLNDFDSQMDTLAQIDAAMAECEEISQRSQRSKGVTPADAQRHNTLLQKISLLKNGVTADAYRMAAGNALLIKNGQRPVIRANDFGPAQRGLIESWRMVQRGEEIRDVQTAGQGIIAYPNASGSTFVPTRFFYSEMQNALRSHGPLFDADKVTFVQTDDGRGGQVPLSDDTDAEATVVGEAEDDSTYTNIGKVTQIMNYTFMYRAPKIATTIEFEDDALAYMAVNFLQNRFAARIARGVGKDLILGVGTTKPLGLIPSLQANGVPFVTAAGSDTDTGISATGANSIGSRDLRNLYFSVDRPYRDSPKAAWLMADSTLLAIDDLRDTSRRQLGLIKWSEDGPPMLFGKPVYTDPNISPILASQVTVVFGDLSHWMTRYVPSNSYLTRYNEQPGYAEAGLVAYDCRARFGGCLLSNASVQTPINYLQQTS